MSIQKKVFVLGSFVMDLIVGTKRFPERGETVLGETFTTAPGGKGANQAVQMALLGLDVSFQGKLGDDAFGKILLESARDAGVNVDRVLLNGSFSAVGNVQIETREDGSNENRIIVVPGANMEINDNEIADLSSVLKQFDLLVLQQEIPMAINKKARILAKEVGVPVLLNPAPSYLLDEEDYQYITYLVPNEHELAELCGVHESELESLESIKKYARTLIEKGTEHVIVTLGKRGAYWISETKDTYVEALKNVESVDPTAAGDSFIAGLAYGVLHNLSQEDCLTFANHIGALTVSKMGAQTSLSSLEEVKKYIEKTNHTELLNKLN